MFIPLTCNTVSEYLIKFSIFSRGASRTGVPLTSNILSPICNDISSEATSNLETESDEEY